MAQMAKHIKVERSMEPQKWLLSIDGEEFPWYTADGSISYTMGAFPAVTLTIFTDRLEILDDASMAANEKAVG